MVIFSKQHTDTSILVQFLINFTIHLMTTYREEINEIKDLNRGVNTIP